MSTDDTAEVLDALGPKLAGTLIAETNQVNSGHGITVLNAYRSALATGAGWILQVDGDGQFEAEDIELLFRHAEAGAAIVTGEREIRFDPWYRKVVTGTLPSRSSSPLRSTDVTSTVRSGSTAPMCFLPSSTRYQKTRSPHMF